MSGARAGISAAEINKGGVGAATVKRYWPGKAPDWVDDDNEQAGSEDEEEQRDEAEAVQTAFQPPVVIKRVEDPRLARLAQSRAQPDSDGEEPAARHRRTVVVRRGPAGGEEAASSSEAESSGGEGEEEEVDEEALAARRAALRARAQQEQEVEVLAGAAGGEEEESSEYETDSEDEANTRQLLKPMFVPKAQRDTIEERDRLLAEEEARYEKEKERLKERKRETRELVIQRLEQERAESEAANAGPVGVDDINTDDEADEEGQSREYNAWEARERARVAKDRADREKEAREAGERERLKNMTEEERRQWERENPKMMQSAPKSKWKFMQKYWHKGAYYQTGADDEFQDKAADDIYTRDYSAPTGEDQYDKTILPKVMQVKNFGRRGRTKYTHLLDQDTTVFDNPLAPDAAQQEKYNSRMSGMDQTLDPKQLKLRT